MASRSYEELYGVSLLDDLHNYFPALLYESDSFESVTDVLDYVAEQTQARFDLYSFGLNAYRRQNQEAEASRLNRSRPSGGFASSQIYTRDRLNPNMTNYSYTYRSSVAPSTSAAQAVPPPPPPPTTNASPNPPVVATVRLTNPSRPPIQIVQMEESDDLSMPLTRNVLSAIMGGIDNQTMTTEFPPTERRLFQLLNLLMPATQSTVLNREFLEPVVVRPTEADIAAATVTGTVSSETNCAICQDTITTSQEARKILHCEHWFHKDCIDPWFRMNVACPVCRFDIRDHDAAARMDASTQGEESKTHEN